MRFVELNPKKDLVVPLALYSRVDDDPRSTLRFPTRYGLKWGFADTYDNMKLKLVFYVFSPSVLPLPPEVLMFNVDWITTYPYGIQDLLYVFNIFDITGLKGSVKEGTMVFGAYRKPVDGTIPLYVHRRLTPKGPVSYLSLSSEGPKGFDWISRQHIENPGFSPIFVMSKKPISFSVSNSKVCMPSLGGSDSINTCSNNINNSYQNIGAAVSPKEILGNAEPDHDRDHDLLIIIIPLLIFLGVLICFFLTKS